ncbi:MAG: hypothetical protein WCD13_02025 [Pseudolabrys sp.]
MGFRQDPPRDHLSAACWGRFAVLKSFCRSNLCDWRRGVMIRQSVAVSITYGYSVGLVSLAVVSFPFSAYAQSADLVLCDRIAADPSDPDKPADVKGMPEIAQSDVPTAIKFCKIASASVEQAMSMLLSACLNTNLSQ